MKPTRATLADVARLAGVSLGSASRALSVPDQVKPQTLASVQRAVEQLGYVRNGAAQALASRKTRTVAAIYPTLNNPIYADSIQSLQQTLWGYGYQLLIASHEYRPARELEVLRAILERGVDGLVLVGTDHPPEVIELTRQYDLPYVLTWSVDETQYPHCVGFSNFEAAYRLARRIVEFGHRRVAMCGGSTAGNERVRARQAGTRAALREAGLDLRPDWIVEAPFTFEGGRQALRELWDSEERPSVVICGTDLQAIGLLDECRAKNIRVPQDLSVTGFDDIEQARLTQPPLTTVRVPSLEIGARAARHLMALIDGRSGEDEIVLDAPVVERDTLSRPLGGQAGS
ncbi:LacI family DNA-binding transcriptional regulator [Caballeronia grimmiae]|uniref:Transcriptional regulator n=1 Tax=Caballeronia grimmiae TaxID=1071679 RepID=A0A069NG92_9BURK|nr:LacI family DNA-binding transcriptional regulator [Caballeronia grimmiae]KDR27375.1 LacI family transcriptional regulator [Caballeronia grimmiae]GGD74314.1 transcriptional regulator [Caballeronia grimmiae]